MHITWWVINKDEKRLVQYLLSESTQRVKIDGEYGNAFQTMIWVPQKDAPFRLLFIFYFDTAMRNYKITQDYMEIED